MGKTDKVLSVPCIVAIIGLWLGFFKLVGITPIFWTPASVVCIVVALALFGGVVLASVVLMALAYLLWVDS